MKKDDFDFIFEEPLEILHGEIGTAPYAHPYRLLRKPVARKEDMVELGTLVAVFRLSSTLPPSPRHFQFWDSCY